MGKTSYPIDKFKNYKKEIKLLDVRARHDLKDFIPSLVKLGFKNNMRVLDVGAGTGLRAFEMAKFLKKGSIVGIDTSEVLHAYARTRLKEENLKNVRLERADITSESDLKKLGRFDFIYIRLVIQHFSDPHLALSNLRKILKPKGIIFVEDTDRDWMGLTPSVERWDEIHEKIKRGQKRRGGDPHSGAKLGPHLAKAGFKNVKVQLIPVFGEASKVREWIKHYAPSLLNHLNPADKRKANKVLGQLYRRSHKENLFYYQIWFRAIGQK